MRTPEASDNAEAKSLSAFLQTDAAGPRTPEEGGGGGGEGIRLILPVITYSTFLLMCVCAHSGSAVCVSVLADRLELPDKLSTWVAMALMLVSATT